MWERGEKDEKQKTNIYCQKGDKTEVKTES